ncbi:cysteine proteinase [Rozella allomycis CSF55]|uniref:Cysteine proteinase n=1 Tax=Rozella allomycis (strain CSF55) TaxID=988480 RepID=A0A4P9YEU0_ROZAC|nr:cysteine proteinase [Rozella allomycis CSF55]
MKQHRRNVIDLSQASREDEYREDFSWLSALDSDCAWLDDQERNLQELLEEENENVASITTFMLVFMEEAGFENTHPFVKRIAIFEKDILLAPVHYASHWQLAVVYPQEGCIRLYNSFDECPSEPLMLLQRFMKKEWELYFQSLCENEWKATMITCPRQTDASNCEIVSCLNARKVVTNKPDTTVGMYVRQKIKTSICQVPVYAEASLHQPYSALRSSNIVR